MANRYWVGGTGNWSDDDNHWATESGGTPADGNLPTSSDNVHIDPNSGFGGGGTIRVDIEGNCLDFTSNSGYTYTITVESELGLNIYGSFTAESGLTCNVAYLLFLATTSGKTITQNGAILETSVQLVGEGGEWTLQDDLTTTYGFYQENGLFDANDYNITANSFFFYADEGYAPTVIMGSGIWSEFTGGWEINENGGETVTLIPETSTIKFTNEVESDFLGGGKTYYNFWTTTPATYVWGSNTFNDFKVDAGVTVVFVAETTQTVSSFTAIGTSGNLITLESWTPNTQFNLSKMSGIVSCDYLDLTDSNATGGATWYAGSHSVDTTNNDGWKFIDPLAWGVKHSTSWSEETKHPTPWSGETKHSTSWSGEAKHLIQ